MHLIRRILGVALAIPLTLGIGSIPADAVSSIAPVDAGTEVAWTVTSSDTLEDSILRALENQSATSVAASLESFSKDASEGKPVAIIDSPRISLTEISEATEAAAHALKTNQDMPESVKALEIAVQPEAELVSSGESLDPKNKLISSF